MDIVLASQDLQLSNFGAFLLKQRFVKEGIERYLVFWARKLREDCRGQRRL